MKKALNKIIIWVSLLVKGGKRFVKQALIPIIKTQASLMFFVKRGDKISWFVVERAWGFQDTPRDFFNIKVAIFNALYHLEGVDVPINFTESSIEVYIEKRFKDIYTLPEKKRHAVLIKLAALAAYKYQKIAGFSRLFDSESDVDFFASLAYKLFKQKNKKIDYEKRLIDLVSSFSK